MIAVLTNIPTPYRTPFFNQLVVDLKNVNSDLHVFYCAKTEPRRFWKFQPKENKYTYTFLKGFTLHFKSFYPHFNFGIIKELVIKKPEKLMIAGAWNTPTMLIALFVCKLLSIHTVFWSEGHLDSKVSNNLIINWLRCFVFRKFNSFVVPNNKSKKYIEFITKRNNLSIGYLPNTIDETIFNEKKYPSKKFLRKKYNIPITNRCIVLISTLNDRKGVIEFIEAYSMLTEKEKSKLSVIFIGEGELKNNLLEFKNNNNLDNVIITGNKEILEVCEILKLSDVFALPTKLDPNPLTPIEASFMKNALLVSIKAGNFNELVFPDNGVAIKKVSVKEIFKSLNQILLYNDEEILDMGEFSHKNVVKNYSRQSASENLIKFLNTI